MKKEEEREEEENGQSRRKELLEIKAELHELRTTKVI